MASDYQQRVCEFCLGTSDVHPVEYFETAGWTEVDDVEGALDRCPDCTTAALPRQGAPEPTESKTEAPDA